MVRNLRKYIVEHELLYSEAEINSISKRVFLVNVSNRNTVIMGRVIADNVLPSTTKITDQWRAYVSALNSIPEYNHPTIKHSLNFVCPTDRRIHTQSIEGFWSQAKRFLRERHGLKQTLHVEYLLQFIWEYRIERNKRINMFLKLLVINP